MTDQKEKPINPNPKKKRPSDRYGRVRVLEEREETIVRPLDEREEAEAKNDILSLMDRRDKLDEELTQEKGRFKRLIDSVELDIQKRRAAIKNGLEEVVILEVCLTQQNEVIHVNKQTGLRVGGPRPATAAERQEPLPLEPPGTDKTESDEFPDFGGPPTSPEVH